jgi:hypothetical protein
VTSLNVPISSTTPVTITFTTDDTNVATLLSVTSADLTMLPTGWTSSATSLACSSVSTGTSCQLPLTYMPTASGAGMLSIAFSYTNNAGIQKTGMTVPVTYSAM